MDVTRGYLDLHIHPRPRLIQVDVKVVVNFECSYCTGTPFSTIRHIIELKY